MRNPIAATRSLGRLKAAELTSTLGAGVIGGAIGLVLAPVLGGLAIGVLALGVLMHGSGMADQHAIETRSGARDAWWVTTLYWFCWIVLATLLVYAAAQAIGQS